jgi:hypothetical protein
VVFRLDVFPDPDRGVEREAGKRDGHGTSRNEVGLDALFGGYHNDAADHRYQDGDRPGKNIPLFLAAIIELITRKLKDLFVVQRSVLRAIGHFISPAAPDVPSLTRICPNTT